MASTTVAPSRKSKERKPHSTCTGGHELLEHPAPELRDQLQQCHDELRDLLQRQKAVSDEYNEILNGNRESLGLIENSKKTMKNLDAAIVTAKQPGYFSYYKPPHHIRHIVSNEVLMDKLEEIEELEDKIDDLKEKMRNTEQRIQSSMVKERKCKSLDEWFDVHGRPSPNYGGEGFATAFKQNPRVHAGTKYLEGFRSNATIMKPGRLTK
eukprot:gb/GECG01016765.1/.p1 GENE.gb/GECG01016765.1/~~gb/GECG01016765.1/.p1  ORF type:complete len:210 (+),score=32.04 gb/GECG01016765.1/:1-630(+)